MNIPQFDYRFDQPIIETLADTDLYKFTMAQAYLHHYPGAQATFRYKCRTKGVDLRPLIPAIQEQVNHVATLGFTKDEQVHAGGLSYIKSDFVDFLRIYRPNADHVHVGEVNGEFDTFVDGPLLHNTWWEIYLLAIVSELYAAKHNPQPDFNEGERRLREKIKLVREFQRKNGALGLKKLFRLIEFGTRRRFSRKWQQRVLEILMNELSDCLVGTSNVDLARRFGLRPFGTHAHEWFQMHQATSVRLSESQALALDVWAREYRGQLGIALTDVINMESFLKDFDLYFAKLFDGCRHDSGDPRVWANKLIAHYQNFGINSATKYGVFSNGLNFPEALSLCDEFEGPLMTSFGIGTDLTNDLGPKPLSQVVKMIICNGQAVAKISDEPDKSMCEDDAFLSYLRHVFQVRQPITVTPTKEIGEPAKVARPGGGL